MPCPESSDWDHINTRIILLQRQYNNYSIDPYESSFFTFKRTDQSVLAYGGKLTKIGHGLLCLGDDNDGSYAKCGPMIESALNSQMVDFSEIIDPDYAQGDLNTGHCYRIIESADEIARFRSDGKMVLVGFETN